MRRAHPGDWDNEPVQHSSDPLARDPGIRTVVHLLRHGKVENPRGVLYGRLPGYHLSAVGRAMADGIAAHLRGADITYPGLLAVGTCQGDGGAARGRDRGGSGD